MKRAISQPQLNEEKYNENLLPKMRKDLKLTKVMSSSKSIAQIRENRETIENVPKTASMQARMINNKHSELLGIKYHLGHTAHLPKEFMSTERKYYLTKSSIAINKLKDMMHIVDNIEFKLKSIRDEEFDIDQIKSTWLKPNDINFDNLKQTTKKFQTKQDTTASEFELSYFNCVSPKEEIPHRIAVFNDEAVSLSDELENEKMHLERIQNELNYKSAILNKSENKSIDSQSNVSDERKDKMSISKELKNLRKEMKNELPSSRVKSNIASDQSKEFSRFDYDPKHKNESDVVASYQNLPKKFRRRYEEMLLIPREAEVVLAPNSERTFDTHSEAPSHQEQSSIKSEQYITNIINAPVNKTRTKSVAKPLKKKEISIYSMKDILATRPGKSKLVQSILNRNDSASTTSLLSKDYHRHINFI